MQSCLSTIYNQFSYGIPNYTAGFPRAVLSLKPRLEGSLKLPLGYYHCQTGKVLDAPMYQNCPVQHK